MSKNRANELTVKLREVFGDKSKLRFCENPKITIAIVGCNHWLAVMTNTVI